MGATSRARLPDAPNSGLFQVISLGGSSNDNQQIREYKRRRPHKKSRAGCLGCKQRRVKCDQAMPTCLRCRRNQRDCVYESAEPAAGSRPRAQHPTQQADQPVRSGSSATAANSGPGRPAVGQTAPKTGAEVGPGYGGGVGYGAYGGSHRGSGAVVPLPSYLPSPRFIRPMPFQITGPEYGTPSVQLLNHFEALGSGIFDMPNFMGPMLSLALQFSHFRCTMLAVAASHLYHKAPAFKGYQIAKHYQQTLALQSYQQALSTPFVVQGQTGVDVLLMTAMIMNMLSFVLPMDDSESLLVWTGTEPGPAPPCADPDPDPRRSWVFSTHPDRLGWLALQMGLTPLLIATAPWREKSRLRLLFANSDDERRTLSGNWQSLSRVPQTWLDLFGVDRRSTPRAGTRSSGVNTPLAASPGNSPGSGSSPGSAGETISEFDRLYRAPLRVIAEIRHMPPNERNLLQYFQFVGQLDSDFRQKLLERDEKALWLFGMWMGILCRYSHVWWTRRRTRCDFRAIRLWLHLVGVDQRPGREGLMWQQLLRDLDETWGYDFYSDPIMQRV